MTYTFVVDGMLGKLAKWLRILGYSTYYAKNEADDDLLKIASLSKAVLLTRDRHLKNRAEGMGINSIYMPEDLAASLLKLNRLGYIRLEINLHKSRCPLCNTKLEYLDPSRAEKLNAPHYVVERYSVILYCPRCGKFYWPGSHYIKMLAFLQRINEHNI